MQNIDLPEEFTEEIDILDSQGGEIILNVPAGILTGQTWMRDASTDVGFAINNETTTIQNLLDDWPGETGHYKIKWINEALEYKTYAVQAYNQKKQLLFIAAPTGAASLTPPIAEGGSSATPTLQEVLNEGRIGAQIHIGTGTNYVSIENSQIEEGVFEVLFPSKNGYIQVGQNVKKYIAKIVQTGTAAPVATVFENELGMTPTITRSGVGTYTINTGSSAISWANTSQHDGRIIQILIAGPDLEIFSRNITSGLPLVDGFETMIEIRIY